MMLYKESMRRLTRMGLGLMLLTLIATIIYAVMDCDTLKASAYMASALRMTPALGVYAYIGGVGLAFTGFSFLRKRPDSDFYHSIPVRRKDLYCSVVLASATWMLMTVVVSALTATLIYLVTGTPFVPAYPFMNIGFFFAAALLVFAAASIGCCLTGTLVTNAILTALVLFLPRYILFMIGRTLIADTGLMGWLDLGWLLDPSTNAATGLIVMLSRRMYLGTIVNIPGMVWSLLFATAEIVLGGVLFVHRPSELADRGAGTTVLQIVYANLLALPVLLVFMLRPDQLSPIFIIMIFAASLAVYIIYQAIAMRSAHRILLSLPWYIASVVLSIAMLFGTRAVAKQVQSVSPDIAEVAYVSFPGQDRNNTPASYGAQMVSKVRFTERDIKQYVIETLRENINMMQTDGYLYYSEYCTIMPVKIVLENGRTIDRVLVFDDGDELNDCLSANAAYREAIRSVPPQSSVKTNDGYMNYVSYMNSQEMAELLECYFKECESNSNLILYSQYQENLYHGYSETGSIYLCNEQQSFGTVGAGGYVGTQRYYDSFEITLATPKTAALWMRICNSDADEQSLERLAKAYQISQTDGFSESGGYFDVTFTITGFPAADGRNKQLGVNFWKYGAESTLTYSSDLEPYMDELIRLMCLGTMTEDPNAMNVQINWSLSLQDESMASNGSAYYSYTEADAARIVEIVREWNRILGNDIDGTGLEPVG